MAMHTCHAKGCSEPTPPRLLMCRPHWYMVPYRLRQAVWGAYRPGQESDKRPSEAYLRTMRDAIEAVAQAEKA